MKAFSPNISRISAVPSLVNTPSITLGKPRNPVLSSSRKTFSRGVPFGASWPKNPSFPDLSVHGFRPANPTRFWIRLIHITSVRIDKVEMQVRSVLLGSLATQTTACPRPPRVIVRVGILTLVTAFAADTGASRSPVNQHILMIGGKSVRWACIGKIPSTSRPSHQPGFPLRTLRPSNTEAGAPRCRRRRLRSPRRHVATPAAVSTVAASCSTICRAG